MIAADATLRRFLAEALADEGYTPQCAEDGAAGLVAATAVRPALILLDLQRAALAGLAFGDWYRRQPGPHAPIVLLSDGDLAETITVAEATGAAGFLQLPFDLDHLLTLVAHVARPATAPPVRAPVAPTPAPAPKGHKDHREYAADDGRQSHLRRLAREVGELRPAVARVRVELCGLLKQEQTGQLTPDETRRVAVLRLESEAQRLRLQECREAFERIRHGKDGGR